MIIEAHTKAEYEQAFSDMDKHPIIGDHLIGRVRVFVSIKLWKVTDGHGNDWSGKTTTGARVRAAIKEALSTWLNQSNIR